MFYDSRWFHAHDTKRPSLRPAFGPSLCPLRASRLGHPDLPCAPFTAFSCIFTLKSSHPEGSVREKLQAQDPIRTEAFGEGRIAEGKKEEAALTDLEKGKLFSRTPHPQCLQTLSALIRFVSCTATPGRPDALPPSRIPTHTDCSYNQYKRHNKATVPPRTASRFSLASS